MVLDRMVLMNFFKFKFLLFNKKRENEKVLKYYILKVVICLRIRLELCLLRRSYNIFFILKYNLFVIMKIFLSVFIFILVVLKFVIVILLYYYLDYDYSLLWFFS